MPLAVAVAARIGISRTAVAVLLAISESRVTPRQMPMISSQAGQSRSPPSRAAMRSPSPLVWKAVARAIPPANSTNAAQGTRSAVGQSSRVLPRPSGITPISSTPNRAMLASFTPLSPARAVQPPKGSARKIQAATINANTINTRRSEACQGPRCGTSAAGDPLR